MPAPADLLNATTLTTSAAGVIYAAAIATTALTAIFARTSARRRAAIEILKILLRRNRSR
ncbi:hypothetical protein [Dactylosporangium sp. CA-139066]|uniref:hypothetical protein n=1 Tax=Dactylosporangium sp. CA-139066 TaxID=3239930 RepID=UPI003D900ABE